MRKIKFVMLTLFVLISISTIAHEFWVAPTKYSCSVNEPNLINCYVGEDFTPTIWANRKLRTKRVRHFSYDKMTNITDLFVQEDSLPIEMFFKTAGNHLIAVESKPSYIEMKGSAFNDYLKEDGMLNILEYRKRNNLLKQRSKEFYQRCAKTLLQIGGKNDSTFKLNTGMALEIIPLNNPYDLSNDTLSVYFEFKGKPLKKYQVRTWCKKSGKLVVKSFYTTNDSGIAKLPVNAKGEWMISLVKMEILNQPSKANYESYWGSYTFQR